MAVTSVNAEPVAVVGIGCRLPGGAHSAQALWDLLIAGVNTGGEVPPERWQPYRDAGPDFAAALRSAVTGGNFLSSIDRFDAEFFGISPREAELMDPQQRLLLEVAWEALEHAGIPPIHLAGTDSGVFMGVCTGDYGGRILEDLPTIQPWTGIGAATCAIANRISHVLDLRGPSMAIDTACSASLVAIHLAAQSLRLHESTVALAGGVNVLAAPGQTLTLGSAGALSPDGRSKPFDAAADGYGRGEGAGVLVLKRLSDARRDGDQVLAVIRGSAVNQDGRTNGIMAPCGAAQEHVMRRACAAADVAPQTVDFVEAHGTGTRLGDPMEVAALSAVYGNGREPGKPCLIGSVKANIGHLEGAAGVTSVIKAVLALQYAEIPPGLLPTGLNPEIPWDTSGLRVVTERTAWPHREHPRRAGVSGFGYGGTVAHILLEQAPSAVTPQWTEPVGQRLLFPVSAASPAALRDGARRLADWLGTPDGKVPLASIGHTLALRRTHLPARGVVMASAPDDLAAGLRALAEGEHHPAVSTGSAAREPGKGLVWVFSGHGSQWAGMGRELLSEPVFAAVVDELEPIFREEIGFSPRAAIAADPLTDVDRVQTMIFVLHVGLAALWRARGVVPDVVIGHSVGEIAAAVTAGVLSLADGGRLICRRSALLRRAAGKGAMAMVSLPFDEAAHRLGDRTDLVAAIAASPTSTVLAGEPAAIAGVLADWPAHGIAARSVASDVAFHSPHMDPLLADLTRAATGLDYHAPTIPAYSTALEDPRSTPGTSPAYWAKNLRNPVRLAGAVQAAIADGYRAFLEVSPHPVVAHSIGEALTEAGIEDGYVGTTLRRQRSESASLLTGLAGLHAHGVAVDWTALYPVGGLAALPPYAWQGRRHWHDSSLLARGQGRWHEVESATLLGAGDTVAGSTVRTWHTVLTDETRPYPGSHTLNGVEIVPAAVLVETFRQAITPDDAIPALRDVVMRHPLMTAQQREIQVVQDSGVVRLASRSGPDGPWLTHAHAHIVAGGEPVTGGLADPDQHRLYPADPALIHQRLADVGVPSTGFDWWVTDLLYGVGSLQATVQAPARSWAAVLDAVMSIAPSAFPGSPALRMVVHIDTVTTTGTPPETVIVEAVLDPVRADTVNVLVADPDGVVVARVDGLRYPVIGAESGGDSPTQLVHEVQWQPVAGGSDHPTPAVLIVGAGSALAERLGSPGTAPLDTATDVLVLPPVREPEVTPADWLAATAALLDDTVGRLADSGRTNSPRLWMVTTGVREATDDENLSQAALWGVRRAAHPRLPGGVLDLDPVDPALGLANALAGAADADLVAVRDGVASVGRLVRVVRGPQRPAPECRADGTYLVAGGLGEVGLEAAAWLAERGARRIVLADGVALPPRTSWAELDDADQERVTRIRALESAGVTVRTVMVDLADPQRVAAALDPDTLGLPAIRGVVQAPPEVGTGDPVAALRRAVDSALVAHVLFPPGVLDLFVLCSTGEHLVAPGGGTSGLPVAAAAGAAYDAIAARRRHDGCSGTVSIACPAGAPAAGLSGVPAAGAFEAVGYALRVGSGAYALLRPVPGHSTAERPPLLRALASAESPDEPADAAAGPDLAGLSPDDLRDRVRDEVATQISGEMRLGLGDLDVRRPLLEQGLDSVMTVVIRRRLEKRFGQALPATVFWQQPTVVAITDHLVDLLTSTMERAS